MVKDIVYSGYTANTSDYECADGGMAAMIGLVNEDGHLKTIPQPKVKFTPSNGKTVKHIHRTAEYTNYILTIFDSEQQTLTKVFWRSDGNSTETLIGSFHKLTHVSSIGNTLCVCYGQGIHYFLWKNGGYLNLGVGLPDVRLSFGLQCEIKRGKTISIPMADFSHSRVIMEGEYTELDDGSKVPKFTDKDDIKTLTDNVLAGVNKLISEEVTDKDKFCMPFFVRYALRLYDGTLTCQSAPILMLPTNVGSPVVKYFVYQIGDSLSNIFYNFSPYVPACKLDMKCFNMSDTDMSWFLQYSDIVTSVDIFVSAPISSYDQNGECEDFQTISSDNSFGIFSLENAFAPEVYSGSVKKHNKWKILDAINAAYGTQGTVLLKLPQKAKSVVISEFENCSSFYLLKSIPTEELSQYNKESRIALQDLNGTVKSLVTHEALTDDFDSHDRLIATRSFNYNSRMHFYGLSKILFDGYFSMPFMHSYFTCVFQPTNNPSDTPPISGLNTYTGSCLVVDDVAVSIKQNGKTYIMRESFGSDKYLIPYIVNNNSIANYKQKENNQSWIGSYNAIPFFYHPNPNAYEVRFVCHKASDAGIGRTKYQIILPLRRHSTLNGAFYFNLKNTQQAYFEEDSITYSSDKKVLLPNRIYVSEVNNPFYFPVTGIVSVGNGKVVGLGSATKALSEGQFGSFPLYAFTTDGIWSLSVSVDCTYRSVQPVSMDVCTNTDSITPVDSSVLYATEMGIKSIHGSETNLISNNIYSEYETVINDSFLPHISECYTAIHSGELRIKPFTDFVKRCQMVYDHKHQRVFVFNPTLDVKYAYVFSMKSNKWSMAVFTSPIKSTINAYPDAMAIINNGSLVSFSEDGTSSSDINGFYVTRPIKLDNADMLKTIRTLIQRGMFKIGKIKTILYGSVDLYNWHIIGSSQDQSIRHLNGTPYKYFRIAGVCSFLKDESVVGASIDFDIRYNNKLL